MNKKGLFPLILSLLPMVTLFLEIFHAPIQKIIYPLAAVNIISLLAAMILSAARLVKHKSGIFTKIALGISIFFLAIGGMAAIAGLAAIFIKKQLDYSACKFV